jgi:hypothetical protein
MDTALDRDLHDLVRTLHFHNLVLAAIQLIYFPEQFTLEIDNPSWLASANKFLSARPARP